MRRNPLAPWGVHTRRLEAPLRARWLIPIGLSLALAAVLLWPDSQPDRAQGGGERRAHRPARFLDAPSTRAADLALFGIVRDAQGRPVAGAAVSIAPGANPLSERCPFCDEPLGKCPVSFSRVAASLDRAPPSPLASTRTGADGRFRFEGLRETAFGIWAEAPQGVAMEDRAAPGEEIALTLSPARSIAGTVVDEAGRPIPGARIRALGRGARLHQAAAGATGRFELLGLGAGPFYVVATASGFLPGGTAEASTGALPLRLQLARARALEVRVTRAGRPAEAAVHLEGEHLAQDAATAGGTARFDGLAPGEVTAVAAADGLASAPRRVRLSEPYARITLELGAAGTVDLSIADESGNAVPGATATLSLGDSALARADAPAGRATLGPLSPGDYALKVKASGFAEYSAPLRVEEGAHSAGVTLSAASQIAGRVLDERGRPLGDVVVNADPIGASATSDPQGRFALTVPSPGLYTLSAHHSDWGGATLPVTAPDEGVELSLAARASAEVTVTAEGRPIEGAQVAMLTGTVAYWSDRPSGAGGVVVMRGIPPGDYGVIGVHPRFMPSERAPLHMEEGATARLTVALSPGAAIAGHVRDEAGAPVAGASVSTRMSADAMTTTDSAGHFELSPLKPGFPYRVDVRHPDYADREGLLVRAGEGQLEVVLQRKHLYRGRLMDDRGQPVPQFAVEDTPFLASDGRFEVALTPLDGQVLVAVSAPGFLGDMFALPDAPDLGDLTLRHAPEVRGVVREPGGAPVAGAEVSCDLCDGSVLTGADGRFRLHRQEGDPEIAVTAKKGAQGGRATAREGEEVSLVLRPWARVRISVWGDDGRPSAGALVDALLVDAHEVKELVTDGDGEVLADLAPGSYRIASDPRGPQLITRVSDGAQDVQLGAAPGTSAVTVHVPGLPGHALWLMRGQLSAAADPSSSLPYAGFGFVAYYPRDAVTFRGVPPGDYTLVYANQYASTAAGPALQPVHVGASPVELSLAGP